MPYNNDTTENNSNNYNFLPPISRILNLYTAYSLAGKKGALWSCSTALGDGAIKNIAGVDRNYVSLLSFWGLLSYKSIEKIHSTEKIPYKYKILLDVLLAGSSLYMAIRGEDFFAKNYEAKSAKLSAKFFDESGAITKLENEYSKGYYHAIKFSLNHPMQLLGNKFVYNCILDQVIDITALMCIDQINKRSYKNISELISYFNAGNRDINPKKSAFNLYLKFCIKGYFSMLAKYSKKYTYKHVKNEANKRAAKLNLDPEKTEIADKFGIKIKTISDELTKAYEQASMRTSEITNIFVTSWLYNKSDNKSFISILENYAPLTLTKFVFPTLFKSLILKEFEDKLLYSTAWENLSEKTFKISSAVNKENFHDILPVEASEYSSKDLCQIAKHGAAAFMGKKISEYNDKYQNIYKEKNEQPIFTSNLYDCLINPNPYNLCLQMLWCKMLEIPGKELSDVENTNTGAFNLLNNEYTPQAVSKSELDKLYNLVSELNNPSNIYGVNRKLNTNLSLEINNYKILSQAQGPCCISSYKVSCSNFAKLV